MNSAPRNPTRVTCQAQTLSPTRYKNPQAVYVLEDFLFVIKMVRTVEILSTEASERKMEEPGP